jgi:hypothetical protein
MKNKFLIGILAFFAAIATIIFVLNFSHSDSYKTNYFERKFSEKEILKFDKNYNLLCNDFTYGIFKSSNDYIVDGNLKNKDLISKNIECNIYISNNSFSDKKHKTIKLPDSNVLLVDENNILYSHGSILHVLNLKTSKISKSKIKNVNILNIISLGNLPNKYLFFGGAIINNVQKIGFFVIDLIDNTISESKIIETNTTSFRLDIVTMYAGCFQKTVDNSIIYTCERNPKIFMFDEFGIFYNVLITKDNTPMPEVIKDSNGYCTFSRKSWFTNSGVFLDKENIFVFSLVSKIQDKIIIDQYSKKTNDYIQSFKLDYNNFNASDIFSVVMCKNGITIKFESNYASFKFSRYNDGNFY